MSSIEALKEQARRHEQNEEWESARDLYRKAIDRLDDESQPDIGLHNRVGDILVKLGDYEGAVENYMRATDLYVEAELPNNAIAVCKKVARHLPNRAEVYLRMGQIRAAQGFLVDARENFLTYAARVEEAGDIDEALRALVEFAELAPEDAEIRMSVGAQLQKNDREEEALTQFVEGYRVLTARGDREAAEAFQERIRELDPEADFDALGADDEGLAFESTDLSGGHGDDGFEAAFGEIGGSGDEPEEVEVEFGEIRVSHGDDEPEVEAAGDGGSEAPVFGEDASEADEIAFEPEDAEPEEEGLPFIAFGEDEDGEDDPAEDLPMLDLEAEQATPAAEDTAGAEPSDQASTALEAALEAVDVEADEPAGRGTEGRDWETLREAYDVAVPDTSRAEELVEVAFQRNDPAVLVQSYELLAEALAADGKTERARSVWEQVLSLEPAHATALAALGTEAEATGGGAEEEAPAEGSFVDLGSMIFGEEAGEKTTRFRVAYEEPSGDEEADFAKMLDQFKAKVAEHFDASDVKSHHDLGTAYKEMGLLDEAVSEFQQALRASGTHLPTYELLGQTFMDRGEHAAAVRVLERALKIPSDVEDELIGIYYYLGRAHQELGQNDEAVEFYDRVFALDINFADVTARLRELR